MKIIITEEMRYRQRVVEFAIKYNNNAKAARRYRTSRQQVQRWRKKYDGTAKSLAKYPKSRWKPDKVTYPGDKVQVDIKYVPFECIGFDSHGIRYYQITG